PLKPEILKARLVEIEDRLFEELKREGAKRDEILFHRSFEMRYRRQLNEIEVVVPVKEYDEKDIMGIMDLFEKRYEEVYGEGSAYREAGIEIISFRVDAVIVTPKPKLKEYKLKNALPPKRSLKGYRDVYFTNEKRLLKTKIYESNALEPGNVIEGPAIIEAPITTIVLPTYTSAKVDRYFNVEINL
ncbi:MAG: hypothetical protein SV062_03020, partial [Thermodesulfobacteriota bacterium]|nr:hypothetical protein [Thermodesulfobacteriota bacterium]